MKTYSVKHEDFTKKWIQIDAAGQTVGRLASEISRVLRGKHKPTFTPYLDTGDHVVVTNVDKVTFTGRKWDQKNYYRHTGYIGGIKATSAKEMLESHPERILRAAVKGMLPKNKLSRKLMTHLKLYAGEQHPHEAQKPTPHGPRLNR